MDADSIGDRLYRLYRLYHYRSRSRVGFGNQHDGGGAALPRQRQEPFEGAKAETSVECITEQDCVDICGDDLWRCRTSRFRLSDRKSTRLNSSHANISY